ncbi:MAG: shikimate kinase, partial [Bacteroidales bacterium]|nr:shikimate kinase [Bacteroidales bacterium]
MGNVILIGFMGCGKTTVGLKLSYRLRRAVIDTDKEIEKDEKRSISDIFATDGEAYFRDRETDCLKKLIGSG